MQDWQNLTLKTSCCRAEAHTHDYDARAIMDGAYIPADNGQRVTQS